MSWERVCSMLAMFVQEMKYQKSVTENCEGYTKQLGRKVPAQSRTDRGDEERKELRKSMSPASSALLDHSMTSYSF